MAQAVPRLTVVVLTWNEARNIGACLDALARQTSKDFEVVVVDAASTDATAAIVREAHASFPVPLRLHVAARRLSVGAARALGVAMAAAPAVAFLSADAVARGDWAEEALRGLEGADLVYGPQQHMPAAWTLGASVRGLRYHHFPTEAVGEPERAARLASHVNAAMRAEVPRHFPFGSDAASSAVDDLLLATRAVRAGRRAAFHPGMVVWHRDAATLRDELRKDLREGLGWGAHVRELGWHRAVLAWAALLGLAVGWLVVAPGALPWLALLAVAAAPSARRAWRRRKEMPARALVAGLVASPACDLAFLGAYLRGLAAAATRRQPTGGGRPRPEALEMQA